MDKMAALSPEHLSPRRWYQRMNWSSLINRQEPIVLALLLGVIAVLSLRTDTFLTGANILNVARSFSWIAIAAFGVSMTIIIGGIDLSVAAVIALSGLICALAMQVGAPVPVAILAGVLAGAGVGLVNGVLVGQIGLPSFIVTLGTLGLARGITLGLTDGRPVGNLPDAFRMLGQQNLPIGPWTLPLPVIWMLGVALVVSLLLNQTILGRYIYTVGVNERALQATGVPIRRLKVLVYTLGGIVAAIAGIVMTARLGVAQPTAANGYEFDIIAAAVIGGASLFGGEGSVSGVLLGAALMQVVRNGLVLLNVPSQWHQAAIGAMILVVLLLDFWRRQRSRAQ